LAKRPPIVLGANGFFQQLQTVDQLGIIYQTEIDLGPVAVKEATFAVENEAVDSSSRIIAFQSGEAATGRQFDENQMDLLAMNARFAGGGSFALYVYVLTGRASGKFKVNYLVG